MWKNTYIHNCTTWRTGSWGVSESSPMCFERTTPLSFHSLHIRRRNCLSWLWIKDLRHRDEKTGSWNLAEKGLRVGTDNLMWTLYKVMKILDLVYHKMSVWLVLSYCLPPFLSASPILFLWMQLKYPLFSKVLSKKEKIALVYYVCTLLKCYGNLFSLLFTYLSLPVNYESLRAMAMFDSFETPTCKTVCKNLEPHGIFVERMDFYFQNSVLISDRVYILHLFHSSCRKI